MSALWRPVGINFPFSKGSGVNHPAVLSNLAYTRQKLSTAPEVCMVDQYNCAAFWAWYVGFYEIREVFGSLLLSIRKELEEALDRRVTKMDSISLSEMSDGNLALSVSIPHDSGRHCSCLFVVDNRLSFVSYVQVDGHTASVSKSCTLFVCKLVGNLLKFCSRITCVGIDTLSVNLSASSFSALGQALFNYEQLGQSGRFYYGVSIQKARPFYNTSDVNECILVI